MKLEVVVHLELPPRAKKALARFGVPVAVMCLGTIALAGEPVRSSGPSAATAQYFFHVKEFGAKVDGRTIGDGAIASGAKALTSSTARWTQADIGKLIVVQGAGASGAPLATTIASIQGAHSCSTASAAATTVTSARVDWGSDDRAAIQAAIAAASAANPLTSVVQLGVGTSMISDTIAVDYSAGQAGITIGGFGDTFQGSRNYSRIASGAPMASTVTITTLGLHMHDVWIDGNDLASNTLVLGYLTSGLDAERFMVSGAVPVTGSEVSILGTREVDNVSFRRFQLFHEPRGLGRKEKSFANLKISNSNAFNINLEHGVMWDGSYGAWLVAGGANIRHCQIFGNIHALIHYESIQASCFEDIYTEGQDGVPFLSEGNGSATNGDSPILVKDCIINSRSDVDVACKQPLVLDSNRLGGNVNIVPAGTPAGGSAPIGIFHVTDRATSFAVRGRGFTGDLTMLEQIGTTVAGGTDPKFGYFTTSPELSANSTHLTRVARSLEGSETIAPRVLVGAGYAVSYTVDSKGHDAWIVNLAPGGASITLPAPTVGRTLRITDGTGAANRTAAITVLPHARETIDGTSSYSLSANWGSALLYCADGVNWIATR